MLEHVGAFLQLYREEARYLERTAPWVARVGIDYVRRRIVEDGDGRRALHRRFLFSQSFVQKDPWAERAAGAAAHEYRALAEVGVSAMPARHAGSRSGVSTTSRGAARGVSCRPDGAPPIAVFRTGDDEIFALIDRCPHRGGPLSEGIVQGSAVACPLHGWVIELDSGRAEAPDEGCTRRWRCGCDGDRILLALPGVRDGRPRRAGKRRDREARQIRTTCPYCGVGCGLTVAPDGTIAGDQEHPANRGLLCSKGAALAETLDDARAPAVPRNRRRQGGLGRGARPDRRHLSPARSTSTGRMRSRSTSPASS